MSAVPTRTRRPAARGAGPALPDHLSPEPRWGGRVTTDARIPFFDVWEATESVRPALDVAWKSVLGHGRLIGGPEVEAFEAQFADYCGTTHCVGVANGTDALELILEALGIGPGDEVILAGNTFVATAAAVCAVGAFPRFVDVLPDTLEVDPAAVAAAINARTAAIIAVHLYGQMADIDRLAPLARRQGLVLLEDAAHAPGARFGEQRAGSAGVAGAFSFWPGANLGALGDAGAVVSDDATLIARIRQLADHGRAVDNPYVHEVCGRSSRLDALQAAVLNVRLPLLESQNRRRQALMQHYRERLPRHCAPLAQHPRAKSVHHRAVVRARKRDRATAALDAAGIGWGLHYPVPCHRQPAFAEFAGDRLPVTERAATRILSLPMSPNLSFAQVDRVCEVLSRMGTSS